MPVVVVVVVVVAVVVVLVLVVIVVVVVVVAAAVVVVVVVTYHLLLALHDRFQKPPEYIFYKLPFHVQISAYPRTAPQHQHSCSQTWTTETETHQIAK